MNRTIHTLSTSRTALILLLATLLNATAAQTAWAQSAIGSIQYNSTGGYYEISDAQDLVDLATYVNGGNNASGKTFKQTQDIDMSSAGNFEPIGSQPNNYNPTPFNGTYNGQGYAIIGLTVNTESPIAGLFGYMKGGSVRNLTMVNPNVTSNDNSQSSKYAGGIVGAISPGTIENCNVINPTLKMSSENGQNIKGAICGGIADAYCAITDCYYYTTTNYNAVGYNALGVAYSASRTYTLTLNDGITTSTAPAFSYGGTEYYAGTITLAAAPMGWVYEYSVNGSPIDGNTFDISGNATVSRTAAHISPLLGYDDDPLVDGSAEHPYTIKTTEGWDLFCDLLADNTMGYFSDKTVQLGADITVTRMAGGSNHAFTGTFDGGGHTLTVNITGTVQGTAPFCEIKGATIRNLVVTGSVAGKRHSAGLVGFARGDDASVENTIENCLVATNVSIKDDDRGYLGGIVGHGLKCKLTIRGCAFTGSLTSESYYTGGLQGWSDGNTLILENDIFAASSVNAANVGFHPIAIHNNKTTTATVSNVYYTIAPTCTTSTLIAAAGKATRTVAAAAAVTIGAIALTGTATQYTVSGITAYSGGGLQRGQTLYYGSDDQLSLTLSNSATGAPQGYRYDGYTASAGTLSGTTLTMPDADVTISVNTAGALAPIDRATVNKGTSDDPYMIYNKDQLLLLAHRVNGTNSETANIYQGMYFKLGADITFDHPVAEPDDYAENYEAIGGNIGGTMRNFNGTFDGDGHTVSGIRIRKDGSGNAYGYQGLFGLIGIGANIHDVYLTDARIKGYMNVGGIVGLNNGTVTGCTVTDSYITATANLNYGTISGSIFNTDRLTNNYYHGCTVNGTAVTSGKGCEGADITANNGALPAYRLDLGANITTPPGTFAGQTEWLDTPPVGARLAPENGFTLAGNHYFASGYEFTPGSTLASGAAQGYTPRAILGGVLLDLYTPTGDTPDYTGTAIARLTITADCDGKTLKAAIGSDGLQHDVSYMTADGTTQTAQAVALDGTEKNLAAGWYFVGKNISYYATLNLDGDVNLILVDGKTMKVRPTKKVDGISAKGHSLHIYGQTEGTGALNAQTNGRLPVVISITNGTLGIHGGNVNANAEGTENTESAIRVERATAGDALVIDRGTLTANSKNSCGIYIDGGDVRINGGQVTATGAESGIDISDNDDLFDEPFSIPGILTLSGGTLTASSFDTRSGYSQAGTLAIASGLTYTDGTSLYDSTTETATLAALAGKTLQPCLALADAADNTAAITDHAGQPLAVALSGRTLYKDGSWNTLCLPFAVDLTASGPLSGDNVQAMTLNTTTSSFADGTLTLNFTAAETIPAGTPFIIKWDQPANYEPYDGENAATCSDLVSPVFQGVTIDAEKHDATVAGVLTFTGTYAPKVIGEDGDNTILYLGAANKLYYPTKTMTIGTHRAYFQLLGDLTAGEPTSGVRAFALNFGDDEATGIISVHDSGFTVNGSNAWYTLDGRRLDGQPTAKGLYIHGGKKVVVK